MSPLLYFVDHGIVQPINRAKIFYQKIRVAYFFGVLSAYFMPVFNWLQKTPLHQSAMLFSARVGLWLSYGLMAPLENAIKGVFGVASDKKMFWANALPVVALMKYQGFSRNLPIAYFPRVTMRKNPEMPASLLSKVKASITGAVHAAGPFPATVSFIDVPPESRFCFF